MNELGITLLVALVLLFVAVVVGRRSLRLLLLARRSQRLISAYGLERLDNVILEDGMGGHSVLDHLLLTPEGIVVLVPRHCDGALFGASQIDRWTQMIGGKSFHFPNPLLQLEEVMATLRYQLPGIPLEGYILYSGNCRFPKGRPEHLLLLNELGQRDKRIDQAIVPVLDEAWRKLQAQPTAEAPPAAPEHSPSMLRLLMSLLLLLCAFAWLGWRLM